MKLTKSIPIFVVIALIATVMATGGATHVTAQPQGLTPAGASITAGTTISDTSAKDEKGTASIVGPVERVKLVVKLNETPVASYSGGVGGFGPTSPDATGSPKIDLSSPAAQAYRAHLESNHSDFAARLAAAIPGAVITDSLTLVVGGVIVDVPVHQADAVAGIKGVERVYKDKLEKLQTSVSTEFIGAPAVWDALGGQDDAGEGVIVGILDTGIWPEHPSVSDPDPLGKAYAPPPAAPDGGRQCEFSGGANPGAAFACNNKLIGADRFMATYDAAVGLLPVEFTTARDDNGHGTHTLTTAAGNRGVAANIQGRSFGTISGIAPRAHVISYKVCGDLGCFSTDSVAAIQEAIEDGVDVINFSISGGGNPFADAVELAFLDAYSAGVFVAASAGNSGPGAETTDHRGPWVTTVAASTSNRSFLSTLSITSSGAPLQIIGSGVTAGIAAPLPIVSGADAPYSSAACLNPAAAGIFTGKIVVCQRLGGARLLKSSNVQAGGAAGMIIINSDPAAQGLDEFTDNHFVPTIHIDAAEGATLLAYLAANTAEMGSFTASAPGAVQGDRMTAFSSRGGPAQPLGISKPDITAPGFQILAGTTPAGAGPLSGSTGELFQAIAGTSMSSPHIAGSAALLADLHPTWTPGQIKSALMTTAKTDNVLKENGTTPSTPFDRGSGRVDLNVAGNPGLTISAPAADFVVNQASLWDANYPSIYLPVMAGKETVFRNLRNELPAAATWTWSYSGPGDVIINIPGAINIPVGGSHSIMINIDASAVPLGQVRHSNIRLHTPGYVANIPVTIVRQQPNITLTKTCTPGTFDRLTDTTCTLTTTNTTFDDATISLNDTLPSNLSLVPASVTGGLVAGANSVSFNGVINGAEPPDIDIAPGASPAGYIPLSAFGGNLVVAAGDDTITNLNVPSFLYGGEVYSQIGISSNGYVVIGGGSGPDNSLDNQDFPDASRPNNVIAGFWTDLNPTAAGQILVNVLTDGVNDWIVLDWAGVREFSTAANLHSFEIWIGVNGDASATEDVSIAYGANTGTGDQNLASVGAENRFGNRGDNTYFNGVGTLPVNGTELRVTSAPGGPGETKVFTFKATGVTDGNWTNIAELTSTTFSGTNTATFSGSVVRPRADVSVAKAISNTIPVQGETVRYRIRVRNLGASAAPNVVMTDVLPAGWSFAGWVGGTPAGCNNPALGPGATLTCTRALMPAGTSFLVTFDATLTVPSNGRPLNIAKVTTDALDPKLSNNTAVEAPTLP